MRLDPERSSQICQLSPCTAAAYQPPLVANLPLSPLSLQPLHSPGHSTRCLSPGNLSLGLSLGAR